MIDADTLDRRIRIERPIVDASFRGAGKGTWEPVAKVWASVDDILPSHGEKLADGISLSTRPARIRLRWRRGLTASMRLVLLRWDATTKAYVDDRVMQIVAGPAEIGHREGLEIMAEDYSSAGNAA